MFCVFLKEIEQKPSVKKTISQQNKSSDSKYIVYSPDDDYSSDEGEHCDGDTGDTEHDPDYTGKNRM